MNSKLTSLLTLLLAALILLTACGPSSGTPEETGTPDSGTSGEITENTTDETKPADTDAETKAETEAGETEAGETKPSETDPAETEPAETDPAETEPAETEPGETEPTETEPAETGAETEPAETDPAESEPAEGEKVLSASEAAAVLAMFSDRLNASENSFTVDLDQNITAGDENTFYGEDITLSYMRGSDGLRFSCRTVYGENGENEGTISYENGVRTVKKGDQKAEGAWSEAAAEQFLLLEMRPVPFGTPASAVKDADGYVIFGYDALDDASAAEMMGKISAVPTGSALTVTFLIEDGRIVRMKYDISVRGLSEEAEVTIDMDYVISFDE